MDVPLRWDDSCFLCGGGGRMFLRGGMTAVFSVVVGDGWSVFTEVGWLSVWDGRCFQCGGGGGMFLLGGMAASFSVVVGWELFLRGRMIVVFSVVVGESYSSDVGWQLFSLWWWGTDVPQR